MTVSRLPLASYVFVVTLPSGSVQLQVQAHTLTSPSVVFTIIGPPVITAVESNPVGAGAFECIDGQGFGATQGSAFLSQLPN